LTWLKWLKIRSNGGLSLGMLSILGLHKRWRICSLLLIRIFHIGVSAYHQYPNIST
jgi:hypothetical protein